MDGELVSKPPTENPLLDASDLFERNFPAYLSMGMTAEEYWDGDPGLVKAYRKAYQMKLDSNNYMLWLQGRYIYDALVYTSPLYSMKPQMPMPYTKRPYPLTEEQAETQRLADEKERYERIKQKMMALVKRGENKNED